MIVIKKYPNRRLYDTSRSVYINLEVVGQLVRAGHEIRIVDAKDGTDKTKETLLQVVLEVLNGVDLLPVGMLRRMIRAGGTSEAELLMRRQLATGLELMSAQLDRMEALVSPPPMPAPQPMPSSQRRETDEADMPPAGEPQEARQHSQADPELAELRKRLDALERRLSRG